MKYISLKEAAQLSGYAPDYIGQLIRKGKLPGKQIYSNVAWVTTEQAVLDYLAGRATVGEMIEAQAPWWQKHQKVLTGFLYITLGFAACLALLLVYALSVRIDHSINDHSIKQASAASATMYQN